MNRHVIKGRGEHRGQYLCWARMAPGEKPLEGGFVWLPEQRKAARWEDPRYGGRTWATDQARLHNGYFVRLVRPAAITAEHVEELRGFISERSAGAIAPVPCHWFGADFHDAGEDFCRGCAEALVDEKYSADPRRFEELYGECDDAEDRYDRAIGGFGIEHDSRPYCDRCGAKLSGYLTDYGVDEEISALTGECAPGFDDVEGWDALDHALTNVSDDDPRWRRIAKLVAVAREEGRRLAELAAPPGMREARTALLGLLASRAILPKE